ncbi:MAG: TIGR02147 family protein [Oligoflexia bacterium]|nr:TIGR02147 family protein [Oligoflexia bacterium]
MDKDIFDHLDYRQYLLAWIESRPKRGRGLRAALADAIRSPISHVSQVLGGKSDLSPEQAEEMNDFLGHTSEQAEYFLLLVQLGRAGTPKLQRRIETQLQRMREKRLVLKDRLEVKHTLSREDQAIFYSSWQYAAVHILLTIDRFGTKEAISEYLGLSLKKTAEILEFLLSLGLAVQAEGRYRVGTARVHLGNDSPMIAKHHINWRLQAMRALEREDAQGDLHYSSVISISKEDVIRIKALLVKAIESAKAVIRDSPEEELHSFCLDFFRI